MRTPTERQLVVLNLIDRGFSVPMIAEELGVHPSSVKQSVMSMRFQLAAPGIRQLPYLARQAGWLK